MDKHKAIELIEARIAYIGEQGYTYPITSIREHPKIWAIALQPTRPDGLPLYDIIGFDVDKVSGEVSQMI